MPKKLNKQQSGNSTIRCAIYARKSTSEGLDQEFNSLDAQREAGEAYITSQKHEGWVCLPDQYDDGGFTGGNMERPALKRLLADVEAGKVDCIVVYKVDRLSRSLLDFARIMGTLDQRDVSFVSVTQQFSTTSSMGRLTLNILLSFAQFEREIIAERTRDKMSAARRKGKWVGGMPILGYDIDPQGGRLLVNEDEATRVREIFNLYVEQKSLIATAQKLNHRGWTTKLWITKKGRECGGKELDKTNLHRMLTNVTYLGKVQYQGVVYAGEQEAILDEKVWHRVQEILRRNGNGGQTTRNKNHALLKGLLFCTPCGCAMTHTYTNKNPNKRYRYYVCVRAQKQGWDVCPTKSLPAAEIERFVINQIRCIGKDQHLIAETLKQAETQINDQFRELEEKCKALSQKLKGHNTEVRQLISTLRSDIDIESPTTTRLAELQDIIRATEQQITEVHKVVDALSQEHVAEAELTAALSQFDPVWEALSPREQARMIRLLVERVSYDGEKESVAVTFRPSGIKALSRETNEEAPH